MPPLSSWGRGGGGAGSGGTSGGGGGFDWGSLLMPFLGAAGNYFGAQQANRPSTSTGTSNNTSSSSPYGPAGPLIDLGLGAALDNFLNFRPPPPPGNRTGKDTNAMLGRITEMAGGASPFLDPAAGFYGDIFSDEMGGNALRDMFAQGIDFQIPGLEGFIGDTTGQGGAAGNSFMGGSNALLNSLLGELGVPGYGGGGGFDGSGRTSRGGGFRMGGGGGGGAPGGGLEGSMLEPYLMEVLNGKWLGEGNPHVDDLISSFNREAAEGYKEGIVPQIDAQYQRAGRYGSGAYQSAQAGANEEYNEAVQGNIANLLGSNYQFERGNMMDALLSALGEETSRQATSASIGASSAANSAALGLQERMGTLGIVSDLLGGLSDFSQGTRGLGLSAMGLFGDTELGRLGLLGDGAADLDALRLGAMGLAPDLDAARYFGPLNAMGLMQQRDAQGNASRNSRWRHESELPFRMLNEFMGTVMPIATAFSTNTSSGSQSNTQPGAGINPWGALLQGLLGGAMANRGMTGGA